ncbi:hypothetical protein PT974_05887 [Cladobotryum mycophilum]|uniref:Uncharacterized protein n=1 Tax=Cladobotryum mycophilum TaxID=491253 RepID=A0ABR0SL51_9HYPO
MTEQDGVEFGPLLTDGAPLKSSRNTTSMNLELTISLNQPGCSSKVKLKNNKDLFSANFRDSVKVFGNNVCRGYALPNFGVAERSSNRLLAMGNPTKD